MTITPMPAAAPVAESTSSAVSKVRDDIKKILSGIKLPERRAAAPAPTPVAPVGPSMLQAAIAAKSPQLETSVDTSAAGILERDTSVPVVSTMPSSRTQAAAANEEAPRASVEPGASPETQKTAAIASVHTLKDDLQGVVRDQKMSVVRAVSLEEDRRQKQKGQPARPTKAKRRHTAAIVFTSVFVLAALGALSYGAYIIWQIRNSAPQAEEEQLMYVENTYPFPLETRSGSDIKRTLAATRNGNAPLGSVSRIVPLISETSELGIVPRPATIEEFLEALDANVPPDLVRALSEEFVLGIHATESNVPVLIIPVTAFERAFAGMLTWEKTLNEDLAPFFKLIPAQTFDEGGFLAERVFDDAVIRNYDTRVLFQDDGTIGLLYAFPTRNMLIIAEDPMTFIEVLSRLRASRQLQ